MKFVRICLLALLFVSMYTRAELRFITSNEPPTNFVYAGKFTGTTTELVRAMRNKLGWNKEIEVYPWSRAYQLALTTPNVVLFTAGRTQARLNVGFTFIGPVSTRFHAVFTRADNTAMHRETIHKEQIEIVAMRGDWRALQLVKDGYKVFEVTDHAQGLRMLMRGRLDYWISSDLEAPMIARDLGYSMSDLKMTWKIKEAASYMAISPNSDPELVQRWRNTLKTLQAQNFFTEQSERWSNILDAQISYTPEQGYMIKN